jgi:hypothetical protein
VGKDVICALRNYYFWVDIVNNVKEICYVFKPEQKRHHLIRLLKLNKNSKKKKLRLKRKNCKQERLRRLQAEKAALVGVLLSRVLAVVWVITISIFQMIVHNDYIQMTECTLALSWLRCILE